MISNQGAAREVEPGRLTNFEDDDLPEITNLTLPPRRRRPAPTVGTGDVAMETTSPAEAPAVLPEPVALVAAEEPKRRQKAAKNAASTSTESEPETAPATKGPEQRVRPSNVHIPVWLIEPIAAEHAAEGLSNGEIIICAIERAYPRLKDLIHPVTVSGGSLFASRRSRTSRAGDGPLTPLNYRLRESDYATLDQLVREFGASSRGHLITVALTAYFSPTS